MSFLKPFVAAIDFDRAFFVLEFAITLLHSNFSLEKILALLAHLSISENLWGYSMYYKGSMAQFPRERSNLAGKTFADFFHLILRRFRRLSCEKFSDLRSVSR